MRHLSRRDTRISLGIWKVSWLKSSKTVRRLLTLISIWKIWRDTHWMNTKLCKKGNNWQIRILIRSPKERGRRTNLRKPQRLQQPLKPTRLYPMINAKTHNSSSRIQANKTTSSSSSSRTRQLNNTLSKQAKLWTWVSKWTDPTWARKRGTVRRRTRKANWHPRRFIKCLLKTSITI